MPGRPKTERRREATEPPKGSRMSKVGTVIRCTKCKQSGHNRTSCDKRNAASAGNPNVGSQATGSQAVGSQAAGTPHEMVVCPTPNLVVQHQRKGINQFILRQQQR
jgi:alpha-galactosidase